MFIHNRRSNNNGNNEQWSNSNTESLNMRHDNNMIVIVTVALMMIVVVIILLRFIITVTAIVMITIIYDVGSWWIGWLILKWWSLDWLILDVMIAIMFLVLLPSLGVIFRGFRGRRPCDYKRHTCVQYPWRNGAGMKKSGPSFQWFEMKAHCSPIDEHSLSQVLKNTFRR